jgi:hypothetical protein
MNISGPELLLEIDIGGSLHHLLIDSGGNVSVIKPGIVASEIRTTETIARGITGNILKVMGTQVVMFNVAKRVYTHEFLVASLDTEYSGILGVDVLRHMGARVDLRTSTLLLGRKRYQLSGQEGERCQLNREQCRRLQEASESVLINPRKTLPRGQAEMPLPGLNSEGSNNGCWNVVALGSVVLPPLSEGLVIGKLKGNYGGDLPGEVLIEPLGLGTPGA